MKSGEAFGWLIAGVINDHVLSRWDPDDMAADPGLADQDTVYAPCCCGVCAAWKEWFSQNKGITDSYTRHLPRRSWIWMTADGGVDWEFMKLNEGRGVCPNHKEVPDGHGPGQSGQGSGLVGREVPGVVEVDRPGDLEHLPL